jgi:hypothetical protein
MRDFVKVLVVLRDFRFAGMSVTIVEISQVGEVFG